MATNARINIDANLSAAERKVQDFIRKEYNLNLNFGKGGQPLGRITGQVTEFNKSLDAANARVVAFGASASVLYGLNKAFDALISSTIEVQKSLADINVILNVSDAQINKFGNSLFDIAKNTGQSFKEVANAATEFSRQGLGVEETLKRTSDALILSRLSGLDTVKSVEALTAAVNSFASQSVTASDIVNKFANVDAAFAVSSKDLAEAISRVGSSAAQSGVSLDELIGLVTSAQQTTARGGAVIGNSFKTIFTRLQREKVVNLLESLGVSTTDSQGQLKSTISLLQGLASVYSDLGTQQQAAVAESVGGVFQINILKAALADLGKEYSVYGNAVRISSTSTDEAIQRNEALNKTLSAQINQLQQNASQFAAKAGTDVFGPALQRLVGGGNDVLGFLNNADTKSVGSKLGEGILKGIGDVIAGPGLALIGGILLKLFGDFAKFSSGSIKELLGLNNISKQQVGIQESITGILAKNPGLYSQIVSGAISVNQASEILLTILKAQTIELEKQNSITTSIAGKVYGGGGRVTGKTVTVGKAAGYIPSFAQEESDARALGATSSVKAMFGKGTIGGQPIIMNNQETEIPNFARNGDSAVIPRYARGYIPNFAAIEQLGDGGWQIMGVKNLKTKKDLPAQKLSADQALRQFGNQLDPQQRQQILASTNRGKNTTAAEKGNLKKEAQGKYKAVIDSSKIAEIFLPVNPTNPKNSSTPKGIGDILVTNMVKNPLRAVSSLPEEQQAKLDISKIILNAGARSTSAYLKRLGNLTGQPGVPSSDLEKGFLGNENKGAYGALQSFAGAAFELGITKSIGYKAQQAGSNVGDFDIRGSTKLLEELFGTKAGLGDLKVSDSDSVLESFANKIVKELGGEDKVKKNNLYTGAAKERKKEAEKKYNALGKAAGYIPNFADALNNSIAREIGAGAPSDGVYVKQYSDLANSDNPDGLGVFNKRDEGSVSREKGAMRRKGYARGYIPNFADEGSASSSNVSSSAGALGIEFTSLALLFASSGGNLKAAFAEERKQRELNNLELAKAGKKLQSVSNLSIKSSVLGSKFGVAASFAAPIIAQTAAGAIDQSTKGGRVGASVAQGFGTAASYASAGSVVGPWGTAAGALIGSLVALNDVVKQASTDIPEFAAKTKKASEESARFDEGMQQLLPILEKLQNIRKEQGGVADTKEQRAAIKEFGTKASTTNLPPDLLAKIKASNFDFGFAQDIGGNRSVELKTQESKNSRAQKYATIAEQGTTPILSATYNYAGKIKAEKDTGQSLAKELFTPDKSAEQLAQQMEEYTAIMNNSQDKLGDLAKATGMTEEVLKKWRDTQLDATGIIYELNQEGLKVAAEDRKAAASSEDFTTKNAALIAAIELYRARLQTSAKTLQSQATTAADNTLFKGNFERSKSEAMATTLEAAGFKGQSEKLGIANTYNGVVQQGRQENANDLYKSISDALLGALPESITKGAIMEQGTGTKVPGSTGFKDNEQLAKQVNTLSSLGGSGRDNILEDIMRVTSNALGNKAGMVTTTGLAGGDVQQLNRTDVINQIKQSTIYQKLSVDKQAEAEKTISDAITVSQKKNEVIQQQLAAAAAKKVDELIKATIESLNNVGGNIGDVLAVGGPKTVTDVVNASETAANVQNDINATSQQKGSAALGQAQAINALTGGIPVFDQGNPIVTQVQTSVYDALKEGFTKSQEAIGKTAGGEQTNMATNEQLKSYTGTTNLDDALKAIAELKTAKSLGIRESDTQIGKQLTAASLKRIEASGPQGEQLAKAYGSVANATDDPAANAVLSLQSTYIDFTQKTNLLLERISNFKPDNSLNTFNIGRPNQLVVPPDEAAKKASGGDVNVGGIVVNVTSEEKAKVINDNKDKIQATVSDVVVRLLKLENSQIKAKEENPKLNTPPVNLAFAGNVPEMF
jgi:TP901 family phage tail tape measure protein